MTGFPFRPYPPATGLRRVADFINAAADRLERRFGSRAVVNAHELYFDSDAYLADVKNRVLTHYY
jgi:hypothetical protein